MDIKDLKIYRGDDTIFTVRIEALPNFSLHTKRQPLKAAFLPYYFNFTAVPLTLTISIPFSLPKTS